MIRSLPILLYHSVSRWDNSICVRPELFESHMRALARSGRRGVSLDEAREYLLRGKPLPKGSVLITFDDGYLDNLVHAQPIMERYNQKGVVFAVASALEERDAPGTQADADEHYALDEFGERRRRDRFLSWAEARAMDAAGTLAVEAHSLLHASVFSGPGDALPESFLTPGRKTRSFDGLDAPVPWGTPRYPVGPALATRAWRPSEALLDRVREIVPQESAQARSFLDSEANRSMLRAALADIPEDRRGGFETDAEFAARATAELEGCASVFRNKLGRSPKALAWPWGVFAPAAREAALRSGFEALFTVSRGANPPGGAELGSRPPARPADTAHRFTVRARSAAWLLSRCMIYERVWAANLYAKL